MVIWQVNLLAILVAAIVLFVIGFLWYGPIFGRIWMKEMGVSKKTGKKEGMWKYLLLNFIGTLVMVYVLAHFISFIARNFFEALQLGFWIWLGFFASTTLLGDVLWNGKSWRLYMINAVYWLVNLVVASLILFAWK